MMFQPIFEHLYDFRNAKWPCFNFKWWMSLNKWQLMTNKQGHLEVQLAWGPENKTWTPNIHKWPPWGRSKFQPSACQKQPRACYNCSTQRLPRQHLRKIGKRNLRSWFDIRTLTREVWVKLPMKTFPQVVKFWAFNHYWMLILLLWLWLVLFEYLEWGFHIFVANKKWVHDGIYILIIIQVYVPCNNLYTKLNCQSITTMYNGTNLKNN